MSCSGCRNKHAIVCAHCVSHNVRKFNDKLAQLAQVHGNTIDSITTKLHNKLPSTFETAVKLQNIKREIVYTSRLVDDCQNKVDDLRDRLTRRRRDLEEARSHLSNTRTQLVSTLKAQNKQKRKAWRTVFDCAVAERKRAVRESIALHGLAPVSTKRYGMFPDHVLFEIHGLPLASIFSLREYPAAHVVQAISGLAQLTLYLSLCLGIRLPYEISPQSTSSLHVGVQSKTGNIEKFASLADGPSFAMALACLVVDIQHLCRTQGVDVKSDVDHPGKLLYGLLHNASTGMHSDDLAFSSSHDKDKKIRDGRASNWDVDVLAARILDDLTADSFEFVDNQLARSEISIIELKPSILVQ